MFYDRVFSEITRRDHASSVLPHLTVADARYLEEAATFTLGDRMLTARIACVGVDVEVDDLRRSRITPLPSACLPDALFPRGFQRWSPR